MVAGVSAAQAEQGNGAEGVLWLAQSPSGIVRCKCLNLRYGRAEDVLAHKHEFLMRGAGGPGRTR